MTAPLCLASTGIRHLDIGILTLLCNPTLADNRRRLCSLPVNGMTHKQVNIRYLVIYFASVFDKIEFPDASFRCRRSLTVPIVVLCLSPSLLSSFPSRSFMDLSAVKDCQHWKLLNHPQSTSRPFHSRDSSHASRTDPIPQWPSMAPCPTCSQN